MPNRAITDENKELDSLTNGVTIAIDTCQDSRPALLRGDLDWIVMKALEKECERRYGTASSLAADIERYLNGDPIEARPPSASYRLRKLALRHRVALATTAVVMLALIAGIVTSSCFAVIAHREREEAVAAREDAERERDKAHEAHRIAQETLAELREELMDKILVAVMTHNEEEAEAAIRKAQKAGVPDSWINTCRGQLALYSGRMKEAITLLKREASNSVTAKSMLAVALALNGEVDEYNLLMHELETLPPRSGSLSAWDLLFKSLAECYSGREVSIEDVDLAVGMSRLPLAYMIRAQVLTSSAYKTRDYRQMDRAFADIEVAKATLGETLVVMTCSLHLNHVADKMWHVNQSSNYPETAQRMADKMKKDLQSELQHQPVSLHVLACYFEDIGDHTSANEVWSWAAKASDMTMRGNSAILMKRALTEKKSPGDVLDEHFEGSGPHAAASRARVLAFVPGRRNEAREICRAGLRSHTDGNIRLDFARALILVEEPSVFREECERLLETSTNHRWNTGIALKYLAGKMSKEEHFAKATSQQERGWASFTIGLNEFAQGNHDTAREYFQRTVDAGTYISHRYWTAKALLKIIEDAPDAWRLEKNLDDTARR